MKDTFLIEKKLNILSALYENTDSIEEKRNTKIYYNMLLQDLLKSDSVNKKYYSTKITMEDEPLKIKKIKRLYNANLCKKITEKVIKSFLYENDIELREDNILEVLNKYYFKIKNMLVNRNYSGNFDKTYVKDRLTSILLETKIVKKFDKKFDKVEYVDDIIDNDDIIKKGLGKC